MDGGTAWIHGRIRSHSWIFDLAWSAGQPRQGPTPRATASIRLKREQTAVNTTAELTDGRTERAIWKRRSGGTGRREPRSVTTLQEPPDLRTDLIYLDL
jgi:hypothetical protein